MNAETRRTPAVWRAHQTPPPHHTHRTPLDVSSFLRVPCLIRKISSFKRESSTRAPELWTLWDKMAAPPQTPARPEPVFSPLLKLDSRSNQTQLAIVGGN